ncbi:GMP reductase [Flavobacterium nitrogenifigens]|uniref:GMP reductase n=1 Tax=Flavobacterium nitrogenifigens TaxID=1617283 RepID=A0A521BAQ5_9FLAO|nr:GMP reductase [Flavobacterium nitrogenifigens]KAF2335220.1 GMP reductase [Flavobacterium nitrogenifigens]SMO44149.1 GMP reductase [Flavobacterium nitrogenifigens]
MRIEMDLKLGFKDVMFRPKRSTLKSRSEVSLEQNFKFLHSTANWTGIPIMAANMDTVGTFETAKVLAKEKLFTAIHKHYTLEEWNNFLKNVAPDFYDYIAVSTGTGKEDFDKIEKVITANPSLKFICIDVANGYSEHFVQFLKKTRKQYPDKIIIAGNVVTGEMTEELLLAGADIVKVGIGPGSVCTTRVKTGVGYPQLSAIIECADAAHGLGGHIISDGGCTTPGDVAKAFGAGADFVMLGGMLAGHTESGGELIEVKGEKFKQFYGMSSKTAMDKHSGGVAEYRASEGKTVQVPFKGDVIHTVLDILGGIRSTCTYVGASRLKELTKRTTFIRVSEQENQIFTK